jgi:adenylate cyclase
MPVEIERKFLVRSTAWRTAARHRERMRQGYFGGGDRASIRVRVAGRNAWLNVKSRTAGASRLEYEYPIPVADAEEMLARLCEEPALEKVRHRVPYADHVFEVDEFLGANAGLVVAEIELDDASEAFARPKWLGEEVTDDVRYYSSNLAREPWMTWQASRGRE